MKKRSLFFQFGLCALLSACQPETVAPPQLQTIDQVKTALQAAGFDTSEGFRRYHDGYLVEYDIFLTDPQIAQLAKPVTLGAANGRVEHYRTNNLVEGMPRTIRVFMDGGFDQRMQNAFDQALGWYNVLAAGISFQRVNSAEQAEIVIRSFYEESTTLGFSAGFPANGNPASPISLNTYYYGNGTERQDLTTVIAHEIGHAVGFRHTDYMNRSFSCGWGGSEVDTGTGAVLIPGTPSDPSANSWMLACSTGYDRPFTSEDVTAIRNTYPGSSGTILSGRVYRIISRQSGKVLDVAGCNSANGTQVQQWSWLGGNCQRWKVEATNNGYFRILSQVTNAGSALDIEGAGSTRNVLQWPYGGGDWQQWKIEPTDNGYYSVKSRLNGLALDVSGCSNEDGAKLGVWEYWGGGCQQWKFEEVAAYARKSAEEPTASSPAPANAQTGH